MKQNPPPGDWIDVRRRLATAGDSLEPAPDLTPEEDRRILKQRAEVLARQAAAKISPAQQLEVVEFELASERYAFPLEQIREVCAFRDLIPVPCTPSFILGIINLRGEIVTVISLKAFFDLPVAESTRLTRILVLQAGNHSFGVLADTLCDARTIPLDDLQSSLPTLTGCRADYLHGITNDRTVVLDAAKLLSDPRLLVDD